MPSGTEYAKLYGQANSAYCQGNLEDAAVIIKDMIGKYPDDANVVLLQGHIHLGLQQYSVARKSYEKVLQLAKNFPNRSDLVDYARRGLDRIRQLPFEDEDEDFMIAATEAIAYSEADFDPSQCFSNSRSGESEAADPDWQNEGMDGDSDLFNEEDIGGPTVAELSSTDTIGESILALDLEPTHRQAAKTGRNQGRVTQKKYEEEDTRDFREPKRNDEDLDGFSPMGATALTQGLGDSDLFTRSGEEDLSGGLDPEPREPLNASPGVGELNFNPSRPNIPDDKRDSHLA
ncbi:MAG: tetratricopeptide repeat protein, partial [Microcystis sp.]